MKRSWFDKKIFNTNFILDLSILCKRPQKLLFNCNFVGLFLKTATTKLKYESKIFFIRTRPFDRYPQRHIWTFLNVNWLFDADVLFDLLLEVQVLLDLVQEHLFMANFATIEGFLFQCHSVDRLSYFPIHPILSISSWWWWWWKWKYRTYTWWK